MNRYKREIRNARTLKRLQKYARAQREATERSWLTRLWPLDQLRDALEGARFDSHRMTREAIRRRYSYY